VAVFELDWRVEPGEVRRTSLWLDRSAREAGVPQDEILRLDTCLNEVLANVISYGGDPARAAPARVVLETRPGEAAVTVVDHGLPFDPVSHVLAPMPVTLEDAQPGGLGLVMLREYSDSLAYERREGTNRLTFRVRWDAPA
jgi:anti-sigma regulatory factor (Ser/Thr protein kinase)